eukprot:3932175-Rhodomonas_salina.1
MVQEATASEDGSEEKSIIITPIVVAVCLFGMFYCLYRKYCTCRSQVAPATIITSTTVIPA